jgi:hypothetical protein
MNQPFPCRLRAAVAALAVSLLCPALAFAAERSLSKTFPMPADGVLRIANLAGPVEILQGRDGELTVEARITAQGSGSTETEKLLAGMAWVASENSKGEPEWALSYPVDRYRGFAYPRGEGRGEPGVLDSLLSSLNLGSRSTATYLGKRVSVYASSGSGVPELWASLSVRIPAKGKISVRNVVGSVNGGDLTGNLVVDTGSGAVKLGSFVGDLLVDTGSGSVKVERARGQLSVDTGSGSITIGELVGNGNLDTGSGGVRVNKVAAGSLGIDTGSGSVTVADGVVGKLIADTGSGSIQVLGVEVEEFSGDTGSGSVTLESSLAKARSVSIDTGSGSVAIRAGQQASFDLSASQGSGSLTVGYADAVLKKEGHRVVGASRGNKQTRIVVETGSGSCSIKPKS